MQKLLFTFFLSLLSIAAFAQNKALQFPEDFKLKAGETPKNFALTVIDEKAKAEGFISNPMVVEVRKFANGLYPLADVSKMKQMLLTIFSEQNPEGMDIDVAAVVYLSAADLQSEIPKFSTNQELKVFLVRDNYLVIISGDLIGSYREPVNKLATQLASRLGMKRLDIKDESALEPEPEAVEVSAE